MNSTLPRRAGDERARGQRSRGSGAAAGVARTGPAALLVGAAALALVLLAGCGPVHLVANTNIPPPLVTKIPVAVALFIPKDFSEYVHKEERASTDWRVELGRAQTEGITRLMTSMFDRVVTVESLAAASALGSDVRAILEPSIEEYAFVTPRDAGSPFFAVSIKYRVNVYMPDGKLAESWGFTGYGTAPSQGVSSAPPLAAATALAMRDAGAKLAVEFREQAVVRGLIPDVPTPDALANPLRLTIGEPATGGQGPAAPEAAAPSEQSAAPPQPEAGAQGGTPTETPAAAPAPASQEQPQAPHSVPSDSSVAPPPGAATEVPSTSSNAPSAQQQSEESDQPDEESGPEMKRLLAPRP